jgi:3-deoxy-D-manno-octulosonate 8-phosphate phosphatase (KDO 8-P phosphatase)
MDVDGVLTDGAITWAQPAGEGVPLEVKRFDAQDGLGIGVAMGAGLQIAWITGRRSAVVEWRARELGVRELHQGARHKRRVLEALLVRQGLMAREAAYVGDDLNDLPAFDAVGVRVAVHGAAPELAAAADWVTERPGGGGAVREVIETILRAQDRWETAVNAFLARLEEEGIRQ